MSESPVRISVQAEGIEPTERFSAAANELAAAAAEMIENAAEVSGFAYDLNPNDLSIKQLRPGTKGLNIGMPPTVMTHPYFKTDTK